MRLTWVQSLGWEDPLEKEMVIHSSTIAWKNPMDRGAWQDTVHGVAKGRTRLSDFTFTFDFHALEKEMATHSSVLAWRIPGTGEPGGCPMGCRLWGRTKSDTTEVTQQQQQGIKYSSLCSAVNPGCLSVLYLVVYICQSQAPNVSLICTFPFGNQKFVLYICESVLHF